MEKNRKVLLSLKNVQVKFNVRGRVLTAIRGVDFDIYENESIAIVGESGSGKSVLTKTFTGMLDSNGFISNGSIIYSDDELSKVKVVLTDAKVQGYNHLLDNLNRMARLKYAKNEFLELEQLRKLNKERFSLSAEEEAKMKKEVDDLEYQIVELFNQKQLLEISQKEERKAFDSQMKILKKQKQELEKNYKNVKKQHRIAAKVDVEAQNQFLAKEAELKAKIAELTNRDIDRKAKDLNAKIAKEIYLSTDRYPYYTRLIMRNKILNALRLAYSRGDELTDEYLNDLFDVATFRVAFVGIRGDLYNHLEENLANEKLAIAKQKLQSAGIGTYFDEICEYAHNNGVNVLYVERCTDAFIEYNQKGKLDEARRSHILSKILRKETIKTGNIIDGYTQLDLAKIKLNRDWQKIRGARIATVFQDPMTSLNPIVTIGQQIIEVIMKHQNVDMAEAKSRAIKIMDRVGIPNAEKRFKEYPFQYSGGMRQRIVIAIALSCQPKVLICDEPTTALDVTIQAQIINLIKDLQKEFGFTTIYITHDLGVVASVAERVAVLYAGQIVESGTVEEIFYDPRHPYTWALLSSLPQLATKGSELFSIVGTPPSLYNVIKGDAFAERNPYCLKVDLEHEPPYFYVSDTHFAKTWLLDPRAPKIEKPELIHNLHEKLAKYQSNFSKEEYEYERKAKQRRNQEQ